MSNPMRESMIHTLVHNQGMSLEMAQQVVDQAIEYPHLPVALEMGTDGKPKRVVPPEEIQHLAGNPFNMAPPPLWGQDSPDALKAVLDAIQSINENPPVFTPASGDKGEDFADIVQRAQGHLQPDEVNQLASLLYQVHKGETAPKEMTPQETAVSHIDHALRMTNVIKKFTMTVEANQAMTELVTVLLDARSEVSKL